MDKLITSRRYGLLQAHAAVALLGFTGLFGKLVAVDPITLVAVRSLTAAAALALVVCVFHATLRLRHGKQAGLVAFSGIILAAHWWSFFHSIQLSSVSLGVLSFSSYPLFVALLEPVVFRERRHWTDLAACVLIVLGMVLITPTLDLREKVTQGIAWGIFSGFTCAAVAVLNRWLVRDTPPLTLNFYQLLVVAMCSMPGALAATGGRISAGQLGLLALLGVVFTAAPQALTMAALRHLRAQLISVIVALEPVYGVALAAIFLGEVLTPRMLLGGLLLMGAVLLGMRRPAVTPVAEVASLGPPTR